MKKTTPKIRIKPRDIVLISLLAALMLAAQVVFAVLPNIELVSLLVIIYALTLGWRTYFIIGVFVVLEGLIYGFGSWWFCYLYIWALLALAVKLLKGVVDTPLLWACVSGVFGLLFGGLCSITYLFIGGPAYALSYWVSGIPFDITHCIANFIIALVLMKPLTGLMRRLVRVHEDR